MRRLISPLCIVLVIIASFSGCAGYWKMTNKAIIKLPGRKVADISRKWMVLDKGDELLLSRHSPSLEIISITRKKIKNAFRFTKLVLDTAMLPHEIAEIALNEIVAVPGVYDFQVSEIRITQVGNKEGYRAAFSFSPNNGIRRKGLLYGYISDGYYYELFFSATERHYFNSSMNDFEEIVRTFRDKKAANSPP